jgi:5-methyltetrahydrofolate--homocysteine methyltransferase
VSVDFPASVFVEVCTSRVLVGDGAMGTELQRAGLQAGQAGELWNLEQPERVEAIHKAYAEAGADFVLTNTFGANPWALRRHRCADALESINRAGAELARRAVPAGIFILGDIGPTGALLKPLGDATVDQFHEAFLQQANALLAGSADGIIVETMSAVEETVAAVRAAREAGAPFVVASMAFDKTKDGSFRTMMGVRPEYAARALLAAGADIVGANCGTNMAPADFAALTEALLTAVTCPVIIQPNAGRPELVGDRTVYRLSPEDFASVMRGTVRAGARIVGGCCGTTPAHIAALRHMVDAMPTA